MIMSAFTFSELAISAEAARVLGLARMFSYRNKNIILSSRAVLLPSELLGIRLKPHISRVSCQIQRKLYRSSISAFKPSS